MATFNGTEGNDTLAGGTAADEVNGLGGNDLLQGGDGADTVRGGAGNDTIYGNAGDDWVEGGAGNDQLSGGSGQDSYAFREFGAANADSLANFDSGWDNIQLDAAAFTQVGATGRFASGDVRFFAGTAAHDADDRIIFNAATGQLFYDADGSGAGAAQLIATVAAGSTIAATDINVFGTATPTPTPTPTPGVITGTSGNDSLVGTAGNDTIDGGAGADTMQGAAGDDTYIVDNVGDVIIEQENGGIDVAQSSVSYTLGGWVNDLVLTGTAAINGTGNAVENHITGNSAANVLDGGLLADTLTGGGGADSFQFSVAPGAADADVITDFASGTDKIHLDARVMGGLGASGNFSAGDARFFAGAAAHDADDRVIYDSSTGSLWYDADGNGAGAAQLIATITGSVVATDIAVDNGTTVTPTPTPTPTPSPTPTPTPIPAGSIVGTGGNDNLAGTNGADSIFGLGGNDTIFASGGDDWVQGGAGNDSISGSSGQDKYAFAESGAANADQILNFDSGWDSVHLDAAGFANIGATGRFSAGDVRFFAAAGATSGHDADDRIVYNTTNGQLFYDADGSGAGQAQLIATFQGLPAMAATDINVFGTPSPTPSPTPTPTPSGTISGTAGNDSLAGGPGDDTLAGMGGNDTLSGQGGADTFVFNTAPGTGNVDLITDFTPGTDKLQFDASVFTGMGATGSFATNDARFTSSGFSSDVTDRIIYDPRTGNVWYDADGSLVVGSFADSTQMVLVATLQAAPALAASDIVVVNASATAGVSLDGTDGAEALAGTTRNDVLYGRAGNDSLDGLAGNDVLDGGFGSDSIVGGDGNDTLIGGIDVRFDDNGSVDTMDGGLGDDTYVIGRQIMIAPFFDNSNLVVLRDAGGIDTIVSYSGSWTLGAGFENLGLINGEGEGGTRGTGNELNNVIRAYSNFFVSSAMDGADGNDTLIGNDGHDTFRFSAGSGNIGNDSVDGGADSDTLDFTGARSGVTVDFRAGTATGGGTGGSGSVTFANIEIAIGSDFNDRMVASDAVMQDRHGGPNDGVRFTGAAGNDTLIGGAQFDTLTGGAGNDQIIGNAGNDSLAGGTGSDSLDGGSGDDTLNGWDGPFAGADPEVDTMSGGLGNDRFYVDNAADVLTDTGGFDTVVARNVDWTLGAGFENLLMNNADVQATRSGIGNELANLLDATTNGTLFADANGWSVNLDGRDGNDTLLGSARDDTLSGGAGNDSLDGGAGNDLMIGGTGDDLYIVDSTADRIQEFANGGIDEVRASVSYTLADGVDNLALAGNAATDGIGNALANRIVGNASNNVIRGAGGVDTLTGGGGNDSFVFAETGSANADTITDFASGADKIHLDATAMSALGLNGNFAAGDARFWTGSAAHDADDRVIFNSATGQLWYDADGNGAGAAQLIASMTGNLVATDIAVDNGTVASGQTFDNTQEVGIPPISGQYEIDSLLADYYVAWDRLTSNDLVMQYTFSVSEGMKAGYTYGSFNADEQAAARRVLAEVNSITGIQFQEVADGNAADLHFAHAADLQGFAGLFDWTSDIQLDASGHLTSYTADGYVLMVSGVNPTDPSGYQILLHEVGHALGLKHPHDPTLVLLQPDDDNHHTVMTYQNIYPSVDHYQPYDVAALQWLYGTDGLGGHGAYADGSQPQVGNDANDQLVGGAGADYLDGGSGADTLIGGAGNDFLIGWDGRDLLNGGDGDDRYQVYTGDVLSDSSGNDTVYTYVDWTLAPGFENLVILNNSGTTPTARGNDGDNLLSGGNNNERLIGLGGNDTIYGRLGNDTIDMSPGANGSWGADTVDGGGGGDTLDFSHATNAIAIDLAAGTFSGGNGTLSITSIESVIGTPFADNIRGLTTVNDPGAANVFTGGGGQDTITGGPWLDTFVFNAAPGFANADLIIDFTGTPTVNSSWLDVLRFDGSVFTRIGATDFVSGDARLYEAPGAISGNDSTDRLVYDTSTGNLYYDADGSGSGASQLVATLQGAPALDGSQIDVVNGQADPSVNRTGTSGNDSLVGGDGNDTLTGLGGNDTLVGFGGDDSLSGGDGNDQLDGGAGNDTLDGGLGDDTYLDPMSDAIVDAGGIDTVIVLSDAGFNFPATMENLIIRGPTSRADPSASGNALDNRITIETSDHSYFIDGGGGNDTIIGGGAGERISVHASSSPEFGHDVVDGGGGSDVMLVDSDPSGALIDFRNGTITSRSGSTASTVSFTNVERAYGTQYDDVLIASDAGGNELHGTYGNDTLLGGAGNDFLDGDGFFDAPAEPIGHDSLVGGAGNDNLTGGRGNDTLDGGTGNDTLRGGNDNDVFRFSAAPGAPNADSIFDFASNTFESDRIELDASVMNALGPAGTFSSDDARFWTGAAAHDADDRVVYDSATGNLWYDADGSGSASAQLIATLQGLPNVKPADITVLNSGAPGVTVNGTAGNDSLTGGANNDTLNGFDGNDTLDGGAGADSMVGGNGDDVYIVDNVGDVLVEQVNGGIDEARASVSYSLPDWVNNLVLTGSAVSGTGNAVENLMTGNAASNVLSGLDGLDTLVGAGGNDTLTGGAGNDTFVFNVAPGGANADRVMDFASAADTLRLDAAAFSAIGASGRFSAGDVRFYAAAGVANGHDADDRIVYNTSTGDLYYDADGSGSGIAQLVATLNGAPSLAASDLEVVNGTATPSPTPTPTTGQNIVGTTGNDTLIGGSGNDTIFGTAGNDWLEGRGGNDQLSGGSGQDSYVFREFGAANADTLANFDSGWDFLRFDAAAFSGLGGAGHFAAGDARFYAAAGATAGHDADDRMVFNSSTGQLYYDADGSGSGAAQLVATVQGGATVAAGDIWVV